MDKHREYAQESIRQMGLRGPYSVGLESGNYLMNMYSACAILQTQITALSETMTRQAAPRPEEIRVHTMRTELSEGELLQQLVQSRVVEMRMPNWDSQSRTRNKDVEWGKLDVASLGLGYLVRVMANEASRVAANLRVGRDEELYSSTHPVGPLYAKVRDEVVDRYKFVQAYLEAASERRPLLWALAQARQNDPLNIIETVGTSARAVHHALGGLHPEHAGTADVVAGHTRDEQVAPQVEYGSDLESSSMPSQGMRI